MLKAAMWVHGNAFVPEHPGDGHLQPVAGRAWSDVVGTPYGWGRAFALAGRPVDQGRSVLEASQRDRVDTWFHVAVPTPAALDGQDLYLDRFYLLFTLTAARGQVGLNAVHAWDGPRRVFVYDGPVGGAAYGPEWPATSAPWTDIRDERPGVFGGSNVFVTRTEAGARLAVTRGLGLSVLVRAYGGAESATVTFHGAGAEFHDAER